MLKRGFLGIKTAADLYVGTERPLLGCPSSGRALLAPSLLNHTSSSLPPSLHSAESLTHPGAEAGLLSGAVGFLFSLFPHLFKRKGKQLPGVEVGVKGVHLTENKVFLFLPSFSPFKKNFLAKQS